jgi:hypothetical protein
MHFIPVSDHSSVTNADKNQVKGYEVIDSFLRKVMNIGENDPIYALINYFHPEQNKGTLKQLMMDKGSDKIEMGFTHLGAYFGKGYTTNAPMLYHSHSFGVTGEANQTAFGYPANIQVISMEGVPQVELNKNFRYVDICLNSGVMFPNRSPLAYKDSKFKPVNINTALMFYRDWLRYELYLREDESWYTYCAAHKTLVATVALNLPHNLDSFKEVYGDSEGAKLFEQFKLFYNNVVGPDPGFLPEDNTSFEPLWKKQGFTLEQIRPFDLKEYNAYEKARLGNKLKHFKGRKPLGHEDATSWASQSSAEIIAELVMVYADMLDAGQIVTCAFILSFIGEIHERMGISKLEFLLHSMPIIDKAMIAHARIHAPSNEDSYLKDTFHELYVAFGGDPDATPKLEEQLKHLKSFQMLKEAILSFFKSDPLPEAIAAWALLGVVEQWKSILDAGTVNPVRAYEDFYDSVQANLEKAREMMITDPDKVQFYTPPGMVHLICNGIYRANPFIEIKEVCTAIDVSEIQLKNN